MGREKSYEIDLVGISEQIRNHDGQIEGQYTELAPLASMAYLESLSKLRDMHQELKEHIDKGDVESIKMMKEKYADLPEICRQDLLQYAKSSNSELIPIVKDPPLLWGQAIEDYEKNVFSKVNSALNERLIVPAMRLAYEQLEAIDKIGAGNLADFKQDVDKHTKIYQEKFDEVSKKQLEQTKLDLAQRGGFLINNNGKCEYIPNSNDYVDARWVAQVAKLEEAGLSTAQIDFITHNCNQASITGGYNAAIDSLARSAVNLMVDIINKEDGTKGVILHSMSYNNYLESGDEGPSFKLMGTSKLSVDISSLGNAEKYSPGCHKDIKISLNSDSLDKIASIEQNMKDPLLKFTIPQQLKKELPSGEFDFETRKIEQLFFQNIPKELVKSRLGEFNEDTRQRIIKNTLLNNGLSVDQRREFIESAREVLEPEVINKAIEGALVEHLQSELDSLKKSGTKMNSEQHQKLNEKVLGLLKPVIPADKEKLLEKQIPKLVLEAAKNHDTPLTFKKIVEQWWNKVKSVFNNIDKFKETVGVNKNSVVESFRSKEHKRDHHQISR
jgi:hypothetical protein